jgi:hypothetical protein
MTEKTVEQLLAEQNDLLRQQNRLLERGPIEPQQVRFARLADTWDKQQGAWGRFLWKNPYR